LAKALQSEPQWHPFFMTALRTGLRLGELFALRWESIDFVKRRIHVRQSHHRGHLGSPKNGRTRNVPISPALAAVLRDYRHLKGELVFCTAEGNYLTRDRVKRPFERITKAAGLPRIRLHDLRHSFASQLTMAGVPQRAVQLYLGHSDPKMTMRYSHLSPEADDDYVSRLDEKVWAHFGHTSPNFAIATSEN